MTKPAPTKPRVICTRKWPAPVEAELRWRFDVTLNEADVALTADQLKDALDTYDAVCPTVTDKVNGSGWFSGTSSAELITGSTGGDLITAGSGDDCVLGGDGNDTINGGLGTDVCVGGPGSDSFLSCETQIQ